MVKLKACLLAALALYFASSALALDFPPLTGRECHDGAGPAGQPSHLTTAEMFAPRALFRGGVAVIHDPKKANGRRAAATTDRARSPSSPAHAPARLSRTRLEQSTSS